MSKIDLQPVPSGYATTQALNDRFAKIKTALENTVSRDGSIPNNMTADLDFNGYNVLNINKLEAQNVVYNGVDINDGLNYFAENYPGWPEEYLEVVEAREEVLESEQNVIVLEDSTRIYTSQAEGFKDSAQAAAITSTNNRRDTQGFVTQAETIYDSVAAAQAQTNAILGLGLGSTYIDEEGDLYLTFLDEDQFQDVYINNEGYLTLEFAY